MVVTLAIFYYLYLILLAIFFIFSFFVVYHLLRFGYFNIGSLVMVAVYVFVSFMILSISWRSISQIDWQQPLEFISSLNASDNLNF